VAKRTVPKPRMLNLCLNHLMLAVFALLVVLFLDWAPAHNAAGEVLAAGRTVCSEEWNLLSATLSWAATGTSVHVGWLVTTEDIHSQVFVELLFFLCLAR
jgi:hypothetical protein